MNSLKNMCSFSMLAKVLVIVGALNWGLVGVGSLMGSEWNLVSMLLGSWPMVEAIVYVVVGIAGVGMLVGCKCAQCNSCNTCGTTQSSM